MIGKRLHDCDTKALHSKLFSEIRVEFRVRTSFSRVETRRDERHFFRYFRSLFSFVIFVRYFFVFSETRENKNREKKAIFANYSQIIRE